LFFVLILFLILVLFALFLVSFFVYVALGLQTGRF